MKRCLLLLIVLLGIGCSRPSDETARTELATSAPDSPLPEAANVKQMHYKQPPGRDGKKLEFDILDHFEEFLNALTPNHIDPHPDKWESLGVLTITAKDGTKQKVVLFTSHQQLEPFNIGHTFYLGGSSSGVQEAIKSARQRAPKVFTEPDPPKPKRHGK
ncbi:MAG TPA: hypothetical protein VFG04_28585 [Planctomycetaceae bacterium]|jgi:hypothetical protein|nr:hypothetical protein [Planctomycetaceae bacterium]